MQSQTGCEYYDVGLHSVYRPIVVLMLNVLLSSNGTEKTSIRLMRSGKDNAKLQARTMR